MNKETNVYWLDQETLLRLGFFAGVLLPLAVVFTLTNLLEHAAMAGLAFRFLPGLRVSAAGVTRETLRQVRGYSVDAFLAMLAGRITAQTGALVVGGFLGVVAAAHYAIATGMCVAGNASRRTAVTMRFRSVTGIRNFQQRAMS